MTLRGRLTLTVLLVAVPLLAGIAWLRGDLVRREADRSLHEFAVARMEAGGRERCETDPAFFELSTAPPPGRGPPDGGPGPGAHPPPPPIPPEGVPPPLPPEAAGMPDEPTAAPPVPVTRLWAYASDLKSRNPRAPGMPAELAAALASGVGEAGAPYEANGVTGRQLAVRMPWTGTACDVVLVRRIDPAPGEFASFPIWSAAALVVAMLGVVALAAGSVVRRIRKLTEDVGRSAASRYATEVEVKGEDEIADLGRAFNAAAKEVRRHIDVIEGREETQRTFLANTTHDVMTPLTVLQGHLSAIRQRVASGGAVDPEVVNAAVEETHYLTSLVHNLSAVAKLDAGPQQVHLAPVRLDDLVQRVVERHWSVASPRAIEIEFAVPERPVVIDADVTLLEQAVMNLVSNAIRYNHPGGHVAVLLDEPAKGEFRLRVVDDGPGVPDDALARLTERSFRTDEARRRNPEGSDLGLDIVRRVASFHRMKLVFRRSEYGGLEAEIRG